MSQLPLVTPSDAFPPRDAYHWLQSLGVLGALEAVPGDAGSRRYWRTPERQVFAVVPDRYELLRFLRVQRRFARAGLPVPAIQAVSMAQGWLLQEDVGRDDLRGCLDRAADPDVPMRTALELALDLQGARGNDAPRMGHYGPELLAAELDLFRVWYLERHLGLHLSQAESESWQRFCAVLVGRILEQPRVWVHRDFHARNVLVAARTGRLTLIDFQDAVWGPLTYDLASLLWDRYWDWGAAQRGAWIQRFHEDCRAQGLKGVSAAQFQDWTEEVALQRNLKIVGIFCRLAYRDGKMNYLQWLPHFWGYVYEALTTLPRWKPLGQGILVWAPPAAP